MNFGIAKSGGVSREILPHLKQFLGNGEKARAKSGCEIN